MHQLPKSSKPLRIWLRRIFATLGLLVVALGVYAGYTIYHANLRVVVSGKAYRSGQMNGEQLTRTIQDHGIKSIVNLRGENPTTTWHQTEIETCTKLNVIHYDRSLSSGRELTLEEMDELVALLRQAPKPVLIHCLGGADRSGLVSALYEVAIEGRTPEEADRELSIWYGYAPVIRPKVLAMDRSYWRYISNRVAHAELKFQSGSMAP